MFIAMLKVTIIQERPLPYMLPPILTSSLCLCADREFLKQKLNYKFYVPQCNFTLDGSSYSPWTTSGYDDESHGEVTTKREPA